MTPLSPPRGSDEWLQCLRELEPPPRFEPAVAAWLRVVAATRHPAVTLATGSDALPYVNWLQDGMSMDSRLILHNESRQVAELIRPSFATDIRVAVHQQDLAGFLADIEDHRFDFILAGLDRVDAATRSTLIGHLHDTGMAMVWGAPSVQRDLVDGYGDTFFFAETGAADCFVLSRKSLQHRAVRRGGRRRQVHP